METTRSLKGDYRALEQDFPGVLEGITIASDGSIAPHAKSVVAKRVAAHPNYFVSVSTDKEGWERNYSQGYVRQPALDHLNGDASFVRNEAGIGERRERFQPASLRTVRGSATEVGVTSDSTLALQMQLGMMESNEGFCIPFLDKLRSLYHRGFRFTEDLAAERIDVVNGVTTYRLASTKDMAVVLGVESDFAQTQNIAFSQGFSTGINIVRPPKPDVLDRYSISREPSDKNLIRKEPGRFRSSLERDIISEYYTDFEVALKEGRPSLHERELGKLYSILSKAPVAV